MDPLFIAGVFVGTALGLVIALWLHHVAGTLTKGRVVRWVWEGER